MVGNTRSTVVGTFILGALGIGVAAILFFAGTNILSPGARVVVFFSESIAGLDVGAPVTFHGARIGSVKSLGIRFSTETMTARIPVVLELEGKQFVWEGKKLGVASADFERLVQTGLRAQLALQSLITGQLRVDLDFHPGTPAHLVGADLGLPEIPTVPSDLDQLRDQLSGLRLRELVDTAQRALASVARFSNDIDRKLDPLTSSIERTAASATKTLETADVAIHLTQVEASTALRDLDSLLVDARRQLDVRSGDVGRVLASADQAIRQAQALLGSFNDMSEPRAQLRDNLEATVRDLAASASSLRGFAETIERNPNALLMGRARP